MGPKTLTDPKTYRSGREIFFPCPMTRCAQNADRAGETSGPANFTVSFFFLFYFTSTLLLK